MSESDSDETKQFLNKWVAGIENNSAKGDLSTFHVLKIIIVSKKNCFGE